MKYVNEGVRITAGSADYTLDIDMSSGTTCRVKIRNAVGDELDPSYSSNVWDGYIYRARVYQSGLECFLALIEHRARIMAQNFYVETLYTGVELGRMFPAGHEAWGQIKLLCYQTKPRPVFVPVRPGVPVEAAERPEKKYVVFGVDHRGIRYQVTTGDVDEAVSAQQSLRKICPNTYLEFPA